MPMCALFLPIAHETAGAARIRHSLRPLNRGGRKNSSKPRAQRVARRRNCIRRHCEERLRRSNPCHRKRRKRRDGLLRFARNDGLVVVQRSKTWETAPANGQWRCRRLLCNGAAGLHGSGPDCSRSASSYAGDNMHKLILAAASLAALSLAGPASAQAPIVIKFSHVVATNTPKGMAAEKFKELAEKYTGGKVKVEVYPNSQLYKDKEELEALQLGAVQMLAPSNSKFGPIGVKEFEVFDLPYLLPNKAALRKVTDGPIGKAMLKKLESKGMVGLAYWDNGFKEMSANKPLRMPEDYKGLKFRIQSSKVLEAQFRALGAIPQVMAFSEVYQALQTGVVDGQENTPSNMFTQKFHEVQKYTTLTNHGYIGYVVVVNKKFWDDLPADIRGQLEKAMKEATVYSNKISEQENAEALEDMKKSGKTEIITPTAAESEAMRKAMEPLYQDMASRVGKQLIDDVVKATHGVTN